MGGPTFHRRVKSREDSLVRPWLEALLYWGACLFAFVSLAVSSGLEAELQSSFAIMVSVPGLVLALSASCLTYANARYARGTLGYVRWPAAVSAIALVGAFIHQVAVTGAGLVLVALLSLYVYSLYDSD